MRLPTYLTISYLTYKCVTKSVCLFRSWEAILTDTAMQSSFLAVLGASLLVLATAATLPVDDSNQLVSQCIDAIAAYDVPRARSLYAQIKQDGLLDGAAFKLAASMKRALDFENHFELADLTQQLPISVRNVVFPNATSFCIHNLEQNQYLFAPNNDFLHDSENRHVFLWKAGGMPVGSDWTFENTSTETDFKVKNTFGEYLFADNSHYYLNRRNIYTYVRAEWTGISSNVWRLISIGDDVIFQNTWYSGGNPGTKEYLYAPVGIYDYDSNRARLFGWDNNWTNDPENIFRIEAC